jgi:N-acetylglucosaminyldiphosphoundecaprenol N-acetyl-beta-D-mannosaminyltransferase
MEQMLIMPRRQATEQPQKQAKEGESREGLRVNIAGILMDTHNEEEAVQWAISKLTSKESGCAARIVCPNAQLVYLSHSRKKFAQILQASDLVVADGLWVVWASYILGTPLGDQIRGVELMERICAEGASLGIRIYILGGLPGAAARAAERLEAMSPGLRIAGTDCPAMGFESDPVLNENTLQKIIETAPDFLIVALGSPKQEYWIEDNYHSIPARVIIGVGAAVDTFAGLRSRPPLWMQDIGLEWFGRLLLEPQRLWKRYLISNFVFIYLVLKQRLLGPSKPR